MEKIIEALTQLAAEQGRQIVELSKALAIAHEHHALPAMPVQQLRPSYVDEQAPGRLWLTEDEEDAAYSSGELLAKDTQLSLQDILSEAGLDPNISLAQ